MRNKEKSAWLGTLIGPESEQKDNGPMVLRPAVATAHHPSTIMLPGDLPANAANWLNIRTRGRATPACMRPCLESWSASSAATTPCVMSRSDTSRRPDASS